MLPANVRTLADAAAAEAASKAALAATAGYGSGTTQSLESRSPMAVRARRAAYALLLASTLAPRPFRATNLPLAASVFRAARVKDAALSAECARAALAVEALLHPAAPPLHPRAIAPPRGDMNGGVSDGMYETGAFGNDGFGGASWGGDDGIVARKRAPAWGDAAPERLEESEEEEEENGEKRRESRMTPPFREARLDRRAVLRPSRTSRRNARLRLPRRHEARRRRRRRRRRTRRRAFPTRLQVARRGRERRPRGKTPRRRAFRSRSRSRSGRPPRRRPPRRRRRRRRRKPRRRRRRRPRRRRRLRTRNPSGSGSDRGSPPSRSSSRTATVTASFPRSSTSDANLPRDA